MQYRRQRGRHNDKQAQQNAQPYQHFFHETSPSDYSEPMPLINWQCLCHIMRVR